MSAVDTTAPASSIQAIDSGVGVLRMWKPFVTSVVVPEGHAGVALQVGDLHQAPLALLGPLGEQQAPGEEVAAAGRVDRDGDLVEAREGDSRRIAGPLERGEDRARGGGLDERVGRLVGAAQDEGVDAEAQHDAGHPEDLAGSARVEGHDGNAATEPAEPRTGRLGIRPGGAGRRGRASRPPRR